MVHDQPCPCGPGRQHRVRILHDHDGVASGEFEGGGDQTLRTGDRDVPSDVGRTGEDHVIELLLAQAEAEEIRLHAEARAAGITVDSVDTLVDKLKNEAAVI